MGNSETKAFNNDVKSGENEAKSLLKGNCDKNNEEEGKEVVNDVVADGPPPLPATYPVIRVISNLSTTSLKEVSTLKEKRRHPLSSKRRKKRTASDDGATSNTTTFLIYSETSSAESKNPSEKSVSLSDSASREEIQNGNQNQNHLEEAPRASPCVFSFVLAAFVVTLTVATAVALAISFTLQRSNAQH